MRWTERQRAMLREMGLRVWGPDDAPPPADSPAAAVEPSAPAAAPAPHPATEVPAPAADRVAAMDWAELRTAVAACRACALCEHRTQTVFGVGNPRASWMVVGEAPGEQEDLRGEPFVGAAGRLLDRMLLALGLTRQEADPAHQVYIANTLKCRPPGNRNPQAEELARCLPFLERQVELVQPKVILAMGRFAVQSLLGSTAPIGQLRGRIHAWRGRPLVVTYHPAYLLRSACPARATPCCQRHAPCVHCRDWQASNSSGWSRPWLS